LPRRSLGVGGAYQTRNSAKLFTPPFRLGARGYSAESRHSSQLSLPTNKQPKEKTNMNATIQNGNLVVTIPMQKPAPSKTGKTLVVASSLGNQRTTATVDGKPVIIGLNAYIKP
jgi:hypothetical protein